MQSKNKKAMTSAEREHVSKIKNLSCCVCGCSGPSDCHEIEQGQWFTSLPLCRVCHMHPVYGLHGQKVNWHARKLTELSALNVLIGQLVS